MHVSVILLAHVLHAFSPLCASDLHQVHCEFIFKHWKSHYLAKSKDFFLFSGIAESTKTIGQMILSLVMESTVIKKNNESPNQYARDRVIQSDGQGFHRDGHNINNVDQESYFHRNRIKRKLNFSPGQRVLDIPCPNSLTTNSN